jgi:OmpA-OmpF porin, OOP family
MSINLLNSVKGLFTNELVGKAASMLGESESGVSKAIGAVVPTILSGLLSKAGSGSEGASGILNMAKDAVGSGILNNIGGLLGGSASGSNMGGILNIASGLFGDKLGGIGKLISGFSGIKESSAGSLLSMVAPAALGFLGKHAADNNLNASGLASFLTNQKDNITSGMPAGLNLSSLGLSDIAGKVKDVASSASSDVKQAAKGAVNYAENTAAKTGGIKWLLPLLLVVLAALALWYFLGKGCNSGSTVGGTDSTTVNTDMVDTTMNKISDVTTTVLGKVDSATGEFVYDLGKMIDIELPGAVKLNVGENSTEAKLAAFLGDASKTVDTVKGNWFDFTNVRFKTGSSEITDASMAQLKNMVAIAKAYPTAQFKVGGYTDNTGDSVKNVSLSLKRAEVVANQIIKLGASKQSVVGAEGYGPQWPIGDNNTPEGRAQNRRVAVKVKAK